MRDDGLYFRKEESHPSCSLVRTYLPLFLYYNPILAFISLVIIFFINTTKTRFKAIANKKQNKTEDAFLLTNTQSFNGFVNMSSLHFHSLWKHVVQKGDTVVDATCGNGYDTLAMLNLVSDGGHVYAMDIQQTALNNTISLLDGLHDPDKKEMVKLFATCHSKMEQVVPKGVTVRLVAFNLGYLPGGDKTVITKSETTLLGLEAATRIVAAGGVISIMVYVGHPGGMEEYEMVEGFSSRLDVDKWICCKLQMLNRPLAPVLVLLCRR